MLQLTAVRDITVDVVCFEDSHAIRPSQDNLRDSRILPLSYGPLGDRAEGKRGERDAREKSPSSLSLLPSSSRARPKTKLMLFFY